MTRDEAGMSPRSFRDRDFIETLDGLFFTVVGNMHPPGKVISYLKYVPDPSSKDTPWRRGEAAYRRVLPCYGAERVRIVARDILEKKHPEYLVDDPVLGIRTIEVPVGDVKVHYKPEKRLEEIVREPKDKLEQLVAELVECICKRAGVSIEQIGVTGSILLGIHNVHVSDIDLTVYGLRASMLIKKALENLLASEEEGFERLKGDLLKKYAYETTRAYALSIDEAYRLYSEVWGRAVYKGRFFSVHPVLTEEEVPERYGDRVYRSVCMVKAECTVDDARYAMFMPAVYRVSNVRILEGSVSQVDVREVASYESVYADIASEGEKILVYGKLEEVTDRVRGEKYHRIVVGSFEARGKDYIKPERWRKQ